MQPHISLFLVDDHPIFLAGMRATVAAEPAFVVLGEASDGLEAIRSLESVDPDIVVIDISMPHVNGLALVQRLRQRNFSGKCLIMTVHEDRAFLKHGMELGISGYVLKRTAVDQLIPALKAVYTGGLYIDPSIADLAIPPQRRASSGASEPASSLSDGETVVLRHIAMGFTSKEIASKMGIGAKSVETLKLRACAKMSLKSRADIVRYAVMKGWLHDIN